MVLVGWCVAVVAVLVAIVAVMPREERGRWYAVLLYCIPHCNILHYTILTHAHILRYARVCHQEIHIGVPVTLVLCAAIAIVLVCSSHLLSSSHSLFLAPSDTSPVCQGREGKREGGKEGPCARAPLSRNSGGGGGAGVKGAVARLLRFLRRRCRTPRN